MRLQPLIVIVFIAEQLLVSGLSLEQGPLLSTYGMYSNTYDSPDAYEAQSTTSYWLTSTEGRECKVSEQAARNVAAAHAGSADASARAAAQRCFGSDDLRRVEAEQRRTRIDWEHWRPAGETRLSLSAPSASNAVP